MCAATRSEVSYRDGISCSRTRGLAKIYLNATSQTTRVRSKLINRFIHYFFFFFSIKKIYYYYAHTRVCIYTRYNLYPHPRDVVRIEKCNKYILYISCSAVVRLVSKLTRIFTKVNGVTLTVGGRLQESPQEGGCNFG